MILNLSRARVLQQSLMYIKAVVTTNAKVEEIIEKTEHHFEIRVKEKAKNNMANRRIVLLIARYLKIIPGKVRIVNGHHHPHKLLVVEE